MEEQSLAKQLYSRNPESGENAIWEAFLDELEQSSQDAGCEADIKSFFQSRPYAAVCGYDKEHGYFYVSCGDSYDLSLAIAERDRDNARNQFLRLFFDHAAYESALKRSAEEEKKWTYHCEFDYRKIWFGTALEWLAPVVDWMFFTECVERYMALLNRWFDQPHWEYDYERGRIIEAGE